MYQCGDSDAIPEESTRARPRLKNFTSLHMCIANNLQSCLDTGIVRDWMTKGRTILIMKDPEKGAAAGYYRPTTTSNVETAYRNNIGQAL